MLQAAGAEEREAAARALVCWPPEGYGLRVAEWGVWIDSGGELKLVQSVLDEIPPFVHRVGDSVESMANRVNRIMIIDKPVIHLTASGAMAVDLEVQIRHGRPWFAYPQPDDLGLSTGQGADREPDAARKQWRDKPLFLARLNPSTMPALEKTREGYPWLEPAHRMYGSISGVMGGRNEITGVGLHWQSLIVTPQPLGWMRTVPVPHDTKFAWWSRLRDVPSNWVSSGGEAERFVYYDGPTRAKSPVTVRREADSIRFHIAGFPAHWAPDGVRLPNEVWPPK